MYIGTDIVKISRFERLIQNKIPDRVFTESETEYISSKKNAVQTAAGIFAVKEAVLKCLGTGLSLALCDICVRHEKSGKPFAVLTGKAKAHANALGVTNIDISISHDGEYAIAYAIMETDKYFEYYSKAVEKLDNDTKLEFKALLPDRKSETHKGDYGRLFVLAGSVGLTGAAILSCNSALRCGAGLITLGCANELNPIFEASLTEVMTKPFESTDGVITAKDKDKITECIKKSDVALIGPGLGRTDDVISLVSEIPASVQTPCVLDADALYAVSENTDILKSKKCPVILTPHIGEFSRLTGLSAKDILSNPKPIATSFAREYDVTLVLKSHKTLVCTKDGAIYENALGNPGMATGGSGDVLAGCIASFLSQGHSMENAAKLGVYIHSLSADMAALDKGEYSLTPSDIIDFLPYAIKHSKEL